MTPHFTLKNEKSIRRIRNIKREYSANSRRINSESVRLCSYLLVRRRYVPKNDQADK